MRHRLLARFFHVSHNTQILGIQFAYLMIKFFLTKIVLIFLNKKIKKLKKLIMKKKWKKNIL